MSLISVQRSPSPEPPQLSNEINLANEHTFDVEDFHTTSSLSSGHKSRTPSECYFTVRGAAVFLSHQDQLPGSSTNTTSTIQAESEIQLHLQGMLRILRPEDKLSMAVRLQSQVEDHTRYLSVLSTFDSPDIREAALIGFDILCNEKITIGATVPVTNSTRIDLDGDGGIRVDNHFTSSSIYLFRPISIKAMWSLYQFLYKEKNTCSVGTSLSHSWLNHYKPHITTDDSVCSLWYYSPPGDALDNYLRPTFSSESLISRTSQQIETEFQIRTGLRQIMQSVDLDNVTTQDIRKRLENQFTHSLIREYKDFVDKEMLVILGQLDEPSKIMDYLYLGTEWNASNWDELKLNGVEYILNVTNEVDNFFPTQFKYMKIWVSDEATTELLMHWQKTYDFIKEAKENKKRVLVHCKKGISRSASTVIAYCMKEYGWSLEQALIYVKEKRNCITPNQGFMDQLGTFDGVLKASNNRHSAVFNAPKESDAISLISCSSKTSVERWRVVKHNSFQKQTSSNSERALETIASDSKSVPKEKVISEKKTPLKARSFFKSSLTQNKTSVRKGSSPIVRDHYINDTSRRKTSLPDHKKLNGGHVKQCRENIENRMKQKHAKTSKPSTTSFVSTIARKLGHLSFGCKNGERKDWIEHKRVCSSPANTHSVQRLVDVFEKGALCRGHMIQFHSPRTTNTASNQAA